MSIPDQKPVVRKTIKPVRQPQSIILDTLDWDPYPETTGLIKDLILKAAGELFNGDNLPAKKDLILTSPLENNYGDYSSNIALRLAGKVKMSPIQLAEKLALKLNEYIKEDQSKSDEAYKNNQNAQSVSLSLILEHVEPVRGFLNFFTHEKYLITHVTTLLEKGKLTASAQIGHGVKISVEYTDPNPFKEFHLGHTFSNFIGEAVSRLFEAVGIIVWRGNFYGDVGMHVAKSVWGMLEKMKAEQVTLDELEKRTLSQRQNYLGQGYALGVRQYEENPAAAEEIKDTNYYIYVCGQEMLKKTRGWQPIINYRQYIEGKAGKLALIQPVYEAGLRWSLEYFESIYKKLGTKFDGYYPESWVGEYGMKLVEKGLKEGILEKSEGGVVYRGEQDGLHTRVFVNKLGLPTYEAKDLGLAYAKYQDFKYDMSINVFGREIDEYYYVVKAALKKIEPELGKKAFHLAHGMVKLPQGKMSSRTGNVVTFLGLMEIIKEEVLKLMKESDVEEGKKEETAWKVGLAALRYALLKNNPRHDVVFDLDKSISLNGDSGPYLLYTVTRCQSVLAKAGEKAQTTDKAIGVLQNISNYKLNEHELSLLRTLYRFPQKVSEAAKNYSPNILAPYLFDLAQKFSMFYDKHSILSPKEEGDREKIILLRLFLTQMTRGVLNFGLSLLGIETVEKM